MTVLADARTLGTCLTQLVGSSKASEDFVRGGRQWHGRDSSQRPGLVVLEECEIEQALQQCSRWDADDGVLEQYGE